jgi:hypothetical protein
MTSDLVDAAAELGLLLKETDRFESFTVPMDRRGGEGSLGHHIAEFTARYSPLRNNPILLGPKLVGMAEADDYFVDDEAQQWLRDASECGYAFEVMIEWLRSRLPGYPSLGVPHLRPGSPHVPDDPFLCRGFPWIAELRRLGLQFLDPPPLDMLDGKGDLVEAQKDLHAAIRERASWARFRGAAMALSAPDLAELKSVSTAFRDSVRPDRVAEAAGGLLLAGYEFRAAALRECVDRTTGSVREYLDAFEQVDELITVVASVAATVALKGGLVEAVAKRMALGSAGDLRDIDVAVNGDDPMMAPGEAVIVTTQESSLRGVTYPTRITHKWGRLDDPSNARMVLKGRFLV